MHRNPSLTAPQKVILVVIPVNPGAIVGARCPAKCRIHYDPGEGFFLLTNILALKRRQAPKHHNSCPFQFNNPRIIMAFYRKMPNQMGKGLIFIGCTDGWVNPIPKKLTFLWENDHRIDAINVKSFFIFSLENKPYRITK